MSLIAFHRGLIAVAIVFCLGFGTWQLSGAFRATGGGSVLLGATFVLLGLGFSIYLVRLRQFLGIPDRRENR